MTIREQLTAEFRQWPGILGTFFGGVTAILGALVAVIGLRHGSENMAAFGTLALCAGIVLFVVSSRWLAKRKAEMASAEPSGGAAWKQSALAWGLLAGFVALFLLAVQLLTGA